MKIWTLTLFEFWLYLWLAMLIFVFNLVWAMWRILCEKCLQPQQGIYHVFIDFKKAFDRVLHATLWARMKKYTISTNLIRIIKNQCKRVLFNSSIGDWFQTTVGLGVRQGCLLSPTLFNIFLDRIMTDALEDHKGTVSIGGRLITNICFADDIDGVAGEEEGRRGRRTGKILWASGQNHLARNGERGKKTRQTEEEVGRQHQGMDRLGVHQVPEGSGEQGKMEETGCEIIFGAPMTLTVKG